MELRNVRFLVEGNGQITLGEVGPVSSAAVASMGSQCLAMLVKDPEESLGDLLARLDKAIEDFLERDIYVDEING